MTWDLTANPASAGRSLLANTATEDPGFPGCGKATNRSSGCDRLLFVVNIANCSKGG